MIEVTCNDRLGKKVRVKCKYVNMKKQRRARERRWETFNRFRQKDERRERRT
jgi:hypothetical protein